MTDASGRWVMSFNGEIYNYRELKAELEALGRQFKTSTDTEVLINAVAQWGESGLARVRGMFAFGLWDKQNRELWLARDPYGIKPLYVAEAHGTLWFSSQARPLAQFAPVNIRREPAGLVGFYLWGHVPEPFTWWAGIRMFPPGHVQRFGVDGRMSSPRAFLTIADLYRVTPAPLRPGELKEALLDSVCAHLVADVPVGLFLSAGVDSTVIACLAREAGMQLHTVTLAFEEYAGTVKDEAPLAEETARRLGTNHKTVRISKAQFHELLDDFLHAMDQPSIDGLNNFLVSRAASATGLKVALSGLGGDELLGGYPSFQDVPRLLWAGRHIPGRAAFSPWLQRAAALFNVLPPKAGGLLAYSGELGCAYFLRRALHLEHELEWLLDESWVPDGLEALNQHASATKALQELGVSATEHASISFLESSFYMRNQLLRDADWSSMAHGLEVRLPFVDVELLRRLGPSIGSKCAPSKTHLTSALTTAATAVIGRPKTGFTTPIDVWMQKRSGRDGRGSRKWAATVHRLFRSAYPSETGAEGLERVA
jgi:asparagine synthase (glutamine-hydrolysing)